MAADFGDAGLLVLALLGLLVGSFLNVLIYRLPKMMELQTKKISTSFHPH